MIDIQPLALAISLLAAFVLGVYVNSYVIRKHKHGN